MVHPGPLPLVHVDLFRLMEAAGEAGSVGSAAFEALGLEHDELPGPGRILLVEWADAWADPPSEHLLITLERTPGSEHSRRIGVLGAGFRWSTDDRIDLLKTQ